MPKEKASLPLWGLPPFQGETSMISCTEGNGCEPKEKAPAPKGRGLNEEEDLFFSQATEIKIASVQNQKRGRIDGISFVIAADPIFNMNFIGNGHSDGVACFYFIFLVLAGIEPGNHQGIILHRVCDENDVSNRHCTCRIFAFDGNDFHVSGNRRMKECAFRIGDVHARMFELSVKLTEG